MYSSKTDDYQYSSSPPPTAPLQPQFSFSTATPPPTAPLQPQFSFSTAIPPPTAPFPPQLSYPREIPPPTSHPPPQFSYPAAAATGIPVNSTNQFNSANPPIPFHIQAQAQFPWSTGLCDCCNDVSNCCMTCWCPCITFGRIAVILDKGSTSCGCRGALYALLSLLPGCQCCLSCSYRSKLRRQYSLTKSPCCDCCVHCFCEACALCQEYRELQNRGFDMTIGWDGNVKKQSRGVVTAPVVQGSMNR